MLPRRTNPTSLLVSSLQRFLLGLVRLPHRLLLLPGILLHRLLRLSGGLPICPGLLGGRILPAGNRRERENGNDQAGKDDAKSEFLH